MSGDLWSSPPLPQDAPSEAERAAFEPRELTGDEQEDDLPWGDEDDDLTDDEDHTPSDDPAYDDFAGEPDHVRGDA